MIYLFNEYPQITDAILSELICKLPTKRRDKALRFRHNGGRISCAIGYLLFLYGYRSLFQKNDLPDWSIHPSGKPYLSDESGIFFNISHCNGACACILGASPVGIDIQDSRSFKLRQALKTCSESEVRRIEASDNPSLEFCRIWSIKGCLSKVTGEGIFRDIRHISADESCCRTFFIPPDKYMTASGSGADTDYNVVSLSVSDLLSL